jgi:hypothetical protein
MNRKELLRLLLNQAQFNGASCKIPQPAGGKGDFLLWPGILIVDQRV